MRTHHAHPLGARRRLTRLRAGLVVALAVALITSASFMQSPRARAASTGRLRQQITAGRRRESGLAGTVAAANARITQLGASISALAERLTQLQTDLNAKRAQLIVLRNELTAAQSRLQRLEAAEANDQQVLADQVVGSYESDRPDIITVVLEATGFQDLLNQLDFAQRVGHQDARITAAVKAARRAVAAEAIKLGALSARQQQLTDQVLAERNSVAGMRTSLVTQQAAVYRFRTSKAGQLAGVRAGVASLTSRLAALVAAQRAAAARAAAERLAQQRAAQRQAAARRSASPSPSAPSPAAPSGPAPSASSRGGFTFPMPISAAAPPGAWSPDDGVDISAPGGTPLLAVCSGTVVLHGIGGFGPSAPVIHCDAPLDGYDYVYYGHAGPGNWTPIGTHVSQGQVISQVGYGIVGISTGPHLELGFADSSGSPIGPSSAGTMLALLRSAY